MSRTSGEQRRGALDKYVHQHASTVNDAEVCFDETAMIFRNHLHSNETVAASTEAGGSAATAAGTEEGGGGATAGAEEDGGSTEETATWMPKYRGDGNLAVTTPTVSAPLRIHAKAWQEPWKRVKRPVRATEAELTANDAILQK